MKSKDNQIRIFRFIGPSVISESHMTVGFPQACVQFNPHGSQSTDDVLISVGDTLRVWKASYSSLTNENTITVNETKDPITCCDWSTLESYLVITGSTDSRASAIDMNTGQIIEIITAHDHPIHDITFCGSSAAFLTAGFDGSLRFFDLRDLQSSYIYYQTSMPLMRISVNPFSPELIAVFAKDDITVPIIDARNPTVPCHICKQDHRITMIQWSKVVSNRIYVANINGEIIQSTISEDSHYAHSKIILSFSDQIESSTVGHGSAAVALQDKLMLLSISGQT